MKKQTKDLYKTRYVLADGSTQTEYLLTESFFELLEETESTRRRNPEIKAYRSWKLQNQDPHSHGTIVQTYSRRGC